MMKQNEMYKLINMLIAQKIPFQVAEDCTKTLSIFYPSKKHCVCNVICNKYSYGGDQELLEIMGLLTEEEEECDYVAGCLNSYNVFERISTDYYTKKEKRDEQFCE